MLTRTRAENGTDRAPTPEGFRPKDLIGVPWRLAFTSGGRLVPAYGYDLE